MLREKTQRRLFRAVFLLGCVLPTLALAAWAVVRTHPGYDRLLLRLAGGSMGVALDCERVTTPRPGEYEIDGLTVSSPDSGETLVACNRVRARRVDGGWRFAVDACRVAFEPAQFPKLKSSGAGPRVEGRCASLVVEDPSGETICRWEQVFCRAGGESSDDSTPALALWTETEDPADAARLTAYRLRDGGNRVELQTGATPLPLRLVPGALPEGLARVATFQGAATATCASEGLQGRAEGTLRVGALAGEHASWSDAQVELIELAWTGERIDRLHAHLEAREGSLNRVFVRGLYWMLKCHPESALDALWVSTPEEAPIPFGQLACEVELDPTGLTIYGRCGEAGGQPRPGAIAHAVLVKDDQPLLLEPREPLQPVTTLVRALYPDQTPEIPASAEAQDVASRLPAPRGTALR